MTYDDGDSEANVPRCNIRVPTTTAPAAAAAAASAGGGGGGGAAAAAAAAAAPSAADLRVGSRVEVNYAGKGRYYPGKALTLYTIH
jgi:hypothetical protein